jgi:hypothetical protein
MGANTFVCQPAQSSAQIIQLLRFFMALWDSWHGRKRALVNLLRERDEDQPANAQGAHSLKTHLHLKPHQFFDLSLAINESNSPAKSLLNKPLIHFTEKLHCDTIIFYERLKALVC